MRGDLGKGALQQVKVPRVEKEKKNRKAEAEGRPARRMCERRRGWERDRAEAEQSAAAAPDCLAVGEWMDGSKSLQR